MFTEWVIVMFTFKLIVYTMAISSVNKIVTNECYDWHKLGFRCSAMCYLENRRTSWMFSSRI
jgi:hypothetical protein